MNLTAREIAEAIAAVNKQVLDRLNALEDASATLEKGATPSGLLDPMRIAEIKASATLANERLTLLAARLEKMEGSVASLDLATVEELLKSAQAAHANNMLSGAHYIERHETLLRKGDEALSGIETSVAFIKSRAEEAEGAVKDTANQVIALIEASEKSIGVHLEKGDQQAAAAIAKMSTRMRRDMGEQWAALESDINRTKQSLRVTRRHAKDAIEKANIAAEGYEVATLDLSDLRDDMERKIDEAALVIVNTATSDAALQMSSLMPWAGPWSGSITYPAGQLTMYRGSTWRANRTNTNEPPLASPTSAWDIFAAGGSMDADPPTIRGGPIKAEVMMPDGAPIPNGGALSVLFRATIPASWSGGELELRASLSASNALLTEPSWLELRVLPDGAFQETICSHHIAAGIPVVGGAALSAVVAFPDSKSDQILEIYASSKEEGWRLVNNKNMRSHLIITAV